MPARVRGNAVLTHSRRRSDTGPVDGGTKIAAKTAADDGRLLLTLEPLDARAFGGNQKLLDEKLALRVPAPPAVEGPSASARGAAS